MTTRCDCGFDFDELVPIPFRLTPAAAAELEGDGPTLDMSRPDAPESGQRSIEDQLAVARAENVTLLREIAIVRSHLHTAESRADAAEFEGDIACRMLAVWQTWAADLAREHGLCEPHALPDDAVFRAMVSMALNHIVKAAAAHGEYISAIDLPNERRAQLPFAGSYLIPPLVDDRRHHTPKNRAE
jgi:hypothetical protein